MTIEDRLRQAIHARTRSVEPSPDALERITNRLARETPMDLRSSPTRARWLLAAAAAVLLIAGAAVVGGVLLRDDDRDSDGVDIVDEPDSEPSPPTTAAPGTTVPPDPETTPLPGESDAATGALSPERQQAIWPRPSSTVTFDTPEAAARSFAQYYAFFEAPIVGTFRATGSGVGEVPVQATPGERENRVLVRQLEDGNWYVTGALAPDITLADPAALAGLECPQVLSGTALAFEGNVNVRIDAYQPDGDRVQLGRGNVTSSGGPTAGPFSGEIACTYPTDTVEDYVVLTLWEQSEASPPEVTGTLQILSIPLVLPG